MSEQQDDQNPHAGNYLFTGAEAYQRIKELTTLLDANPDDSATKDEFNQLMKHIGTNPEIAAEFSRLRTADTQEAAVFAQRGNAPTVSVSQHASSETAKPEKKYVLEASYDLGKAVGNAAKGLGIYSNASDRKYSQSIHETTVQSRSEHLGRPIMAAANLTGEVIDFWSDLIEGKAAQRDDFIAAYHKIVSDRKIDNVTSTSYIIYTGDIITRKQYFELFKWYTAKAAVRTEPLGNDLYVSWRVYVKEQISSLRIILWLIGCLFAAVVLTVGFNFQSYTPHYDQYGYYFSPEQANQYIQATLELFIKIVIGTGIYLVILGIFRRSGDLLGMFRRPLDEFDRDDAMAAGHIVHKSVLQAADAIGIDSMKLAPKEAVPSDRRRPSRRI